MLSIRKLKKAASSLQRTPLHPQWFSFRGEAAINQIVTQHASELVIDLGCSDKKREKYIKSDYQYIGLDYYNTAISLYESTPDIYGDACDLPFISNCVDTILLTEVLEHVPSPQKAIQEVHRVLKNQGKAIISIPFLYPIHDAPFDYHRWTIHGLEKLFHDQKFVIEGLIAQGTLTETAALISNIAITKTCVNFWRTSQILFFVLAPFIALLIPIVNILGWLGSLIEKRDNLMPFRYVAILRKNE